MLIFTGILSADINGYILTASPIFMLNYVYTRTTNGDTQTKTKFMVYGNGMYLTFDDNTANGGKYLWSTDYINWTVREINPTPALAPNEKILVKTPTTGQGFSSTLSGYAVKNIYFFNNKFIVFSQNTVDNTYASYYSYDGINWTRDPNFSANPIIKTSTNSVAYYGCPAVNIVNNQIVAILPSSNAGPFAEPNPTIPGTIPQGKSNLCRYIILS